MLLGAKQQSVLTRYLTILPEELYEPDAGEWMELKLPLRCSFFCLHPGEEMLWGNLIAAFQYLKGADKGAGKGFFTGYVMIGQRTMELN